MNIIFDLDDTIYNLMEPFERAHNDIFGARSKNIPVEDIFKASRVYSDEAFVQREAGHITKKQEFAYRIKKTYADIGIDVTEAETDLFEEKYRAYQKDIHIPEGTMKILDYCKEKGVNMGVLTNGLHGPQTVKIEVLKLDRWFLPERIFISGDLGVSKPEKEAFDKVQKAFPADPENTWYIGDDYRADVVGAKKAGWHSVFYNHRHRPILQDVSYLEKEVASEAELFEIIKEIIG